MHTFWKVNNMSLLLDATFLERCRNRDPEALDTLVRQFEKPIYRYVVRLAGEREAEDITQEVFLRAIMGLARFRGDASLHTWMYRVATNVCRDHFKRVRWQRLLFNLAEAEDREMAEWASGHDDIDCCESRILIKSALTRLSAKQREAVILRDVEGFTYAEIAGIVGCHEGTVKSRLFYARSLLAKELRRMGVREKGADQR